MVVFLLIVLIVLLIYIIWEKKKGNENMVIGDFGEKARRLFEENKISEGHYVELLNMIGCGGYKD